MFVCVMVNILCSLFTRNLILTFYKGLIFCTCFERSQTTEYFTVSLVSFKKYGDSECVIFAPLVHITESLESK